ncbi:aminoglycoside phosphotransferase family protein [Micromonospora orduensis]|uniref:Aminoglycoside phosphotransferase family protein n=1 Tax=Micromonospora orduensis TaxID=1420891 RepID=A0A5C4QXB4_9ACTN|nr:aminoglycoside phosphotransferase family protein [Micromonospora orduensis]TNH30660.1 aminoglycoside phosphotransferase family protein [Micromonospora orduensis]
MAQQVPAGGAVCIDVPLVRRLLAAYFPQWAELPIQLVDAAGRDNAIFRLGTELSVRLPRRELGARHIANECRWLPMLAPHLPLPVPMPLGRGAPSEGYPWCWTVTRWLPGEVSALEPGLDEIQVADQLTRFITALHTVDPVDGPASELRGVPLFQRDPGVRVAITALQGDWDPEAVTAVWESALAVPSWLAPGVWTHGDLHPANLLIVDGRLSAVIDFGLLSVGDPAIDVLAAWTVLSPRTRDRFRRALRVDEATWARARGRALDFGLMCVANAPRDSLVGQIGRRTIDQVLADKSDR